LADIISWDKAIGKKVKSSDDQDLGKIQSITKDYIQTKEGLVSKNYYFVPKYYIQGYDGDHLWISLTKGEVKSRFEKDKEPHPTEFETPEYNQRRSEVTRQYPDFDSNIPTYTRSSSSSGGESSTSTSEAGTQDSVGMPWEKILDKKVKSSDDQDLGKVQSISSNYVEVTEGVVSKKRYFIPKYYIEGYDGENLYSSITKDEIKNRYQRDAPPSESEFRSQEYEERKRKVDTAHPQFIHGVPFMAREPGVTLRDGQSGEALDIPWEEVVHKHVRTTDDVDIGDVERVGNEFIVVREGVAKVHLYYVPKPFIYNYDGSYLYISTPSGLVSAKFERETEPTPEEVRALAREAPGASGPSAAAGQAGSSGGGKSQQGNTSTFEEGAPGTETGRKDDPLTSYREKEPMTPAKIKEHEPTAVKREMTEKIVEPGQEGTNTSEAAELARRKGMAKGIAGADDTGSESEQGSAGTNK
jgi:hypothetical protein